ncbi:MAG: TIGR00268 family protein, partial [Armatimonadota bacterium]
HHDAVARIEVAPSEMPRLIDPTVAARVVDGLRALGWKHVAADLLGYRTGSMNIGIVPETDHS